MGKNQDPGSGMGKNQDPGFGINIPDPQHWLQLQGSHLSYFRGSPLQDGVTLVFVPVSVYATKC
jgi:hypothetical protein